MKQVKKVKKVQEKPPIISNVIESKNQYGTIKISENVIIGVIKKAACSVEGISKLSGGSFVDSLANMVGSQRVSDKGISIEIKENILSAEVKITVIYGVHIPEVASMVQNRISDMIRQIIGLNVARVDVIIQDIEPIPEVDKKDK